MKKLLKSKIYGSVNSAYRALFIRKVKYFDLKKKNKNKNAKCRRGFKTWIQTYTMNLMESSILA